VAAPPAPPILPDEGFRELIAGRSQVLLGIVGYLLSRRRERPVFTRPLLGELLQQATGLEELLDAYGARNNERWHPFRSTIAAAKLFATVNYGLLHIQHSLPRYRLLGVEGDFAAATDEAILFTGRTLLRMARRVSAQARRLRLPMPDSSAREDEYAEDLPPGSLASDRVPRHSREAGETVTSLATAFLNLAAASDLLHVPSRVEPGEYASCIPKPLGEDGLRQIQHRFHNLQSTYDTFVSDTDTEQQDTDLPVLRGHVSVIFHLLEVATALSHYYERHVMAVAGGRGLLVDRDELLKLLMEYVLVYASRYLLRARDLCQAMLKRYAEVGRVEVSGPKYRGFHVRPSTLVAKIARHYGSEVQMEVDGDTYDAASPMDLFRVNEKLNARKRRWLLSQVAEVPMVQQRQFPGDLVAAVRAVVLSLGEKGSVVIYQRPLPVRPPDGADEKTPLQYILDEVQRLQATGTIDIDVDVRVAFVGDRRVLDDLRVLADCGYGEDNFGNNVPLPKEISYLRR
jgi:hypothetical protein